ncbi:MAG: flavodoxin family protein [Candidatus Pacebacteria bacterium]|nr:flavodoxin family protein [Candidatus Paceibacterota bacterium]
MKTLVIFDSNFGNTKKIAEVIANEMGENAKVVSVADFDIEDLEGTNLLIVGSPINGFRPTEKINKFLANLAKNQLKGIKAASFDTRVKLFIHGDAAKKISKKLKDAGAEIIVEPQAFYVKGKEGPLLAGEIEKAKNWAREIKSKL